MTKRLLTLLVASAFFTAPLMSAYAEDAAPAKTAEEATPVPEEAKPDPDGLSPTERAKQDALTEKVAGIIKTLDLNQVQHFTVIYANYMVLSMVKAVQNDVEAAVLQCGSNNSGMQQEMNTRLDSWKTTIETPKKDSEANINNMIVAQNYLPKATFDDIFALVDETRSKNSSEFEKVPVSTPEACKYMLGKMDETEKNMVQLLTSTLVTYPDLLKKTQE